LTRQDRPDERLPGWDAIEPEPERPTIQPPGTFGLRIRTVSEITRAIRSLVAADDGLRDVWVEGEVGRVTVSSAGHAYFALRDERNQLQCVWFREERLRSVFEARTGVRVVAHGRIDLYEPTGALQLYVDALQPAGHGDLALRLEALKARLSREGLFDTARKRSLPPRPALIGVVTSPSGAVWHDIRTVLARRWPLARVLLVPCQVQGDAAPASIAGALGRLGRYLESVRLTTGPDGRPRAVTIIARGGGSLEDLWSFNDEAVVRAVVEHPVPVVCGVGHEVDTTLADFAADVRAPTPSAAAELVVPDVTDVRAGLAAARRRLDGRARADLAAARASLDAERRALQRLDPRAQLVMSRERLGRLVDRLTAAIVERVATMRREEERLVDRLRPTVAGRLAGARASLETATAALAVLGPQATLDRGYAIVRRTADGRIVRVPGEAPAGTRLRLRVAGGELAATADGKGSG